MGKHRNDLTRGLPLPSTWPNALMEFVSTLTANLRFDLASPTTLRIPGGAGADQVAVGFGGPWRFNAAAVTAVHPGGSAGVYNAWVTANANDLTAVDPADSTNYAFALTIRTVASGAPPSSGATALSRLVAEVDWDGAAITAIRPLTGSSSRIDADTITAREVAPNTITEGEIADAVEQAWLPIGAMAPYAGTGDPPGGRYLLADGRLLSQTTYATLFARVGHKYNGGIAPGGGNFKIPDKRGRVSVGADDMGTAGGSANRLTVSNDVVGANGGEEQHALTVTEMPNHTHQLQLAVSGAVIFTGAQQLAGGVGAGEGTAGTGGNAPHNNMQPYEVDNWIIRVL